MQKADARKWYAQERLQITVAQKNKWDDLLLIRFQQLALPPLHIVCSYAAMEEKNEVSTDQLLSYLEFRYPGLQIAYPKTQSANGSMQAILTNEDSFFEKDKWGVPEPVEGAVVPPGAIDLVFVPLLCFDKAGYRVGYGKGFYDRYLANIRPDTIKVGLSYFEPIDKIEDINAFDISLNYCVTPAGIYEF